MRRITDKLQGPLAQSHYTDNTPIHNTYTNYIITILINRVAVSPARVVVLTYMQRVTNADSKRKNG
jgi:hypothetical protein